MREFLLVVPDLMLAGEVSRAAAGAAAPARLRFGPAEPLAGGWRSWLLRCLGRADLAGVPLAPLVAAAILPRGSSGDPAASRGAWLATPLHLVAGLDTLHLPRDGILALEPAERDALAASFSSELGGGRLTLLPVASDAFLLLGLEAPEATTVEPLQCLGADLSRAQAAGPGARELRRLQAEIEMWLHDHPVNRQRAAQGSRAVRSLWLWGGGAGPGVAAASPPGTGPGDGEAARHPRRVYSDDAWVRAVCRLAAVELAAEGELPDARAFAANGDVFCTARFNAADVPDAESFERRHLGPAVEALAAGRLDRLTVLTADRRVSVAATDRYRLWRPRRPWRTALGA